MKIIGAIIAGGQSRRMGAREKAFLKLAGRPILSHVIERMGPQVDRLVINANGDPARFSEFGFDSHSRCLTTLTTPLAGLHAALEFAKIVGADVLVTVPSDTPFLPPILSKGFWRVKAVLPLPLRMAGSTILLALGKPNCWTILVLLSQRTICSGSRTGSTGFQPTW